MENLPITYADIAILAVLIISGLLALMRGFVRELLHILAWIGAAVIAVKAFPYAKPLVAQYLQPDLLANLATGAGIFIVALVILVFVFAAIAKRVRESDIGMLDRSLGLVFGVARGALVLTLAYMLLAQFLPEAEEEQPTWLAESYGLPYVKQGAGLLTSVAPEVFASALETIEEASDAAQMVIQEGTVSVIKEPAPTTEKTSETGYQEAPRKDLDRLIDSKQKK